MLRASPAAGRSSRAPRPSGTDDGRATASGVEVRRHVRGRSHPAARGRRADGRRTPGGAPGRGGSVGHGESTDELIALAYGMSTRPPLRELDALLSVGETISCALAAIAVAGSGRARDIADRAAGRDPHRRPSRQRPAAGHPSAADPGSAGRRCDRAGHRLPGDLPERGRHDAGPGWLRRVARSPWPPPSGCTNARSSPTSRRCSRPIRASSRTRVAWRPSVATRCSSWPRPVRRCCSRGPSSWPRPTTSTSTCGRASRASPAPGFRRRLCSRHSRSPA